MLILCFVCLTPGTVIRISIARVSGEIIAIVGRIKDWKTYVASLGDMCQRFGPGGGELGVEYCGWGAFQKCHPIRTSVHILEPEFDILATYLSCVKHFQTKKEERWPCFLELYISLFSK